MAQKSPTTFQKNVLAVMCKVPVGKVITYGDVSIDLCGICYSKVQKISFINVNTVNPFTFPAVRF